MPNKKYTPSGERGRIIEETYHKIVILNSEMSKDDLIELAYDVVQDSTKAIKDYYNNHPDKIAPPNLEQSVKNELRKILLNDKELEKRRNEKLSHILVSEFEKEIDFLKQKEDEVIQQNFTQNNIQKKTKIVVKVKERQKEEVTNNESNIKTKSKVNEEVDIQLDFDNIFSLCKTLADGKSIPYSQRKTLADNLGLDMDLVLIKDSNSDELFSVEKFAVEKVLKENTIFHEIRFSDQDVYIVSNEDFNKIMRARNEPFQKYYLVREKKRVEKAIQKDSDFSVFLSFFPEENEISFNKHYEKYLYYINHININGTWLDYFEYVNNKKRNRDKEAARRYSQKYRDNQSHDKEARKKITKIKAAAKKKYNKIKSEAVRLRNAMLREAQIKNRAHIRGLKFSGSYNITSLGSVSNNLDIMLKGAEKHVINELGLNKEKTAVISTNQTIYDSEHIFLPRTPSADEIWYHSKLKIPFTDIPDIKEEKKYQIMAVLKPAIVKSDTASRKINGVRKEIDFGCLFAATYFYTLVANTPIDETYQLQADGDREQGIKATVGEKRNYWAKARIALKRRKNHHVTDDNKTLQELYEEFKARGEHITNTSYRTRIHYPDKESVRGDWVMNFRGVKFKAFYSEPNKKSENFIPDICFDEDDFINPVTQNDAANLRGAIIEDEAADDEETDIVDKKNRYYSITKKGKKRIRNVAFSPYIWNLAEKIYEATKDKGYTDITPEVHNINPRWQILEYGGYQSDKNGPWMGSGKYGLPHGVTESGFSFQAPMGFKRIVDAQYNLIMTEKELKASAYTNSRRALRYNFDITKMDSTEYEELRELFATQDNTLTLSNIHNIDTKTVWKWEDVK